MAMQPDAKQLATARQAFDTAVAAHRAGELAVAERNYAAVLRHFPEHPGALHGLGSVRLLSGQPEEASKLLSHAARRAPKNGGIRSDLASAWLRLGRFDEAAREFEAALTLRPDDTGALIGLGDAHSVLGKLDVAGSAFTRALTIDANLAAAHFGLGGIAMQMDKTAEAQAAFARAIALAPAKPRYHRALAETARFVPGDPRMAALGQLAANANALRDDERVELHFAMAKANDDLGRYDEAFRHLEQGNAAQRRHVAYDGADVETFFRSIAETFSPALLKARAGSGDPSPVPLFIVGMPRSGSSLVEQMLASHPAVFGAGELLFVNDLAAVVRGYPAGISDITTFADLGRRYVEQVRALAPSAERIVDKLPANFRHLGLIHLALPNAKIIHIHRDPMDTCFSCYSKLFLGGLNFAYDLRELGQYYRMYKAMMTHWRTVLPPDVLLDVKYETLVADFERQARGIVEFTGLAWDPRCLEFSKTERPVRTLSQAQVRQPLFASSIGRWRNYEAHLGPLKDALR